MIDNVAHPGKCPFTPTRTTWARMTDYTTDDPIPHVETATSSSSTVTPSTMKTPASSSSSSSAQVARQETTLKVDVVQRGERDAKRAKTVVELEAKVLDDDHGTDEVGNLADEGHREKRSSSIRSVCRC